MPSKASSPRNLERELATANKKIAKMKLSKKLHRAHRDYRYGSRQLEGAVMEAARIVAARGGM